jgi:hypothetical protein
VYGVAPNRDDNNFFHKYELRREEGNLHYDLRKRSTAKTQNEENDSKITSLDEEIELTKQKMSSQTK